MLLDARPPGLDLYFRPGDPLSLTLTWPTDALDGRTFDAFLDAAELTVQITDDTMTITASAAQTTAAVEGGVFQLTDTTADDYEVIIGRWSPDSGAASVHTATVTVTEGDNTVTVSVIESHSAEITALDDRIEVLEARTPANQTNEWLPSDNGMIAWTLRGEDADENFSQFTAGTPLFTSFAIRQSVTASSIWFSYGVAASNPTAGQCWLGIYNFSGTLMASTDISGSLMTINTAHQMSITPVQLTPGYYWVAYLFNGTTSPQLTGLSGFNHTHNAGTTAATRRCGTQLSSLTTLPSSFTPSLNSNHQLMWSAIS